MRIQKEPLRAWYTHVGSSTVAWQSWGDVKAEFGSASHVGNCVVFNIGGNKYRLVTRILYVSQKVFVLKVMTHKEYDPRKMEKRVRMLRAAAKIQKMSSKLNPS